MAGLLVGILRFLHIMSGVGWIGGGLFWGTIITPNILARGPPQVRRPFLEAALGPVTRFFISSAIATIVFGFLLVGAMNGWDFGIAFRAGVYGRWLGAGALIALVMAVHGIFVVAPSGKRLLEKMRAASAPPTAEQQADLAKMGKSMGMHGMLSITLGTAALLCMVAAVNYVR